jgi:hypothetical protein
MKVALNALAHVFSNIRWQSIREQHGLSESIGFLTDIFPGAIDVCPHARGHSANAYFATRENAVPTVLFGLLIPLMTAAVGLRLSGSFASLLSAIPLHWIVAAQVYRIGGGIFLVLWADGRLPWQFALPAGIGDVMTGCLAIVVAVLLAQKAPGALRAAYGWCLFGIADLVVAVTMGAMTSPGRAHLLAFDAPNLLISSYPLVMVPTFAVPLALMLHGLVLLRLRRKSASTGRLAAA